MKLFKLAAKLQLCEIGVVHVVFCEPQSEGGSFILTCRAHTVTLRSNRRPVVLKDELLMRGLE